MLLIFAFFLALMAPISSEATSCHGQNTTTKPHPPPEYRRSIILNYQDPTLRFGHDSFCTSPRRLEEKALAEQTYMVADCNRLIRMLRGDDGLYGGWWLVEDLDCKLDGDIYWATVAGWKSCNFAVITPYCPCGYTAFSRLDVAKAIAYSLPWAEVLRQSSTSAPYMMLVICAFFLALIASVSSYTLSHPPSIVPPHDRALQDRVISASPQIHTVTVVYDFSDYHPGNASHCGPFENRSETPNTPFIVEDCKTLLRLVIAGDPSHTGWWAVKDEDCRQGEDYWWTTVAGWETCNLAVVMPDCPSSFTRFSQLDVAKAISWLMPDDGQANGTMSTGTFQCSKADPSSQDPIYNVTFLLFDPSIHIAQGALPTRLHGLVGTAATSSSNGVAITLMADPTQ
ncbi:hypothetical protein J7T55_001282 [Diaporthe amygdali]|uniref:uncharacterized protein n=1 Tax=Phomopsis amygdali TaxID=1214568 RepID=UPI0022FEDFAC|nr:uncharacterized protein J7T55_001282 [Diaporthe amygdali]KAJ0106758.1 hypothetical protein J7T55_001282 [Diaporthe amygdali]